MKTALLLLATLTSLIAAAVSFAQGVHKCTDGQGRITYQDGPCVGSKGVVPNLVDYGVRESSPYSQSATLEERQRAEQVKQQQTAAINRAASAKPAVSAVKPTTLAREREQEQQAKLARQAQHARAAATAATAEREATESEVSSMLDCKVVHQNGFRFVFLTGTDETGTYAINGTARTAAAKMGWIDGFRKFSSEQMQVLLNIGLTKCRG